MKSENYYNKSSTFNFIFVNVCVIVLAFLAVDASHGNNCDPEEKGLPPPFTFSYRTYQKVTLEVKFINMSPNVTYTLYETDFIKSDRKRNLTKKRSKMIQELHKEDKDCLVIVRNYAGNNLISVLLEMSSNADWCQNVTIFEGRVLYTENYVAPSKYKHIPECSHPNGCTILVNLTRDCTDTRNVITTEEPNSESDDDGTVSTSPRINIDTATFKSTASYENTSETSEDTKTSSSTVTILYSICGVGLTALVTVGIYWCWSTRRPQGTHGLPINQPTEPFYLNMLFRRQCDQEIAEIDQLYEEIDQHHTPGVVRG